MKPGAIILWENRKGYCLVLFDVPDPNNLGQRKKYLLRRMGEWTISKKLYKIPKETETVWPLDDGRKLWETLVKEHDFENIDIEKEDEL